LSRSGGVNERRVRAESQDGRSVDIHFEEHLGAGGLGFDDFRLEVLRMAIRVEISSWSPYEARPPVAAAKRGLIKMLETIVFFFTMATLTTPHVAVLIEMSSAHGRGLIRGIAQYAQRHTTWSLHLEETGPLQTVPPWLSAWRGDGIIARLETKAITRAVLAKGLPVVNVSGCTSFPGTPQVDTDNRAVCELAADYFRQRRYRHFAYCGNPRFEWSFRRQEMFAQCLKSDLATIAAFQLHDLQPAAQLRTWLKSLPKPIALFACNDLLGCHVLETCQEAGLSVPDEIAVLGVDDDTILCTLCRPQLSSIAPDTEGIGYLAAQTLDSIMRGEKPSELPQLVRPLSVQPRQSTDATAVDHWHVSQALRFIYGNATRDISVDDVVVQARTSRRFLEKHFLAVVGHPIHAEILRVRLETAQRLLSTTTLSLKNVATRSGFARADYFSSVFRQKLGLSPSEFRSRPR
jgi:LacI family transcriptional regulator